MAELLVIVPSRGRPDNVRRVIEAWEQTGAFADAHLAVAFDHDDPDADLYWQVVWGANRRQVSGFEHARWQPMVPKLNATVAALADRYAAVGFAGDDHLPRTPGWARAYLDALRELGTGIVYGDDRLQGERLPTQWGMTADIVQALGRMVPADVEHLYCDNAVMALGLRAGCLRYLPDVVVEHMHPAARKAHRDEQYRRVNAPDQYRRDRSAYHGWLAGGLERDAAAVRALRAQVPA